MTTPIRPDTITDLGPPPSAPQDLGAPPDPTQGLTRDDRLRLISNAATFGAGKYLSALLGHILGDGSYADQLQQEKDAIAAAKEKPGANKYRIGGTLAGILATGGFGELAGAGRAGQAISALGSVPGQAAIGATTGALNAGAADPGLTLAQRAERALIGGGIGGVTAGAASKFLPGATSAVADRLAAAKAMQVPLSVAQAAGDKVSNLMQSITSLFPTGRIALQPLAGKQATAVGNELDRQIGLFGGTPHPADVNATLQKAAQRGYAAQSRGIEAAKQQVAGAIDAAHPDGISLPGVQDYLDRTAKDAALESADPALVSTRDAAQKLVDDAKAGKIGGTQLLNALRNWNARAYASPTAEGTARVAANHAKDFTHALSGDFEEAADNAGVPALAQQYRKAVADFNEPNNPTGKQFWNMLKKAGGSGNAPDRLMQHLTDRPDDASAIFSQFTPQEQQQLAAHWLSGLKRTNAAGQNVTQTAVSPATVATELNKVPNATQSAILGPTGKSALDRLRTTLETINRNALPNPSGTAPALQGVHLAEQGARAIGTSLGLGGGVGAMAGHPIAGAVGTAALPFIAGKAQSSQLLVKSLPAILRALQLGATPATQYGIDRVSQ